MVLLTKRVVNGVTHEYFYDGDKLIAEKVGDKYFYFFYDESGVCGFRYENINYEYVKNIFGDVIGIYNEYGTHVATYAYDAWGNMTYCNAGTDVAYINPFLYRGYYYDSESGLYYLMTRYYDTQIGRFISPDTADYLAPDTVGGVDLYAYGLNNPVMYVDPTGHFVLSAWMVGALVGFGVSFVSSLVSQALVEQKLDLEMVGIAAIDGVFGGISGALSTIPGIGSVAGAFIDAGLTFVNSMITTGISNNWRFDSGDWNSIAVNTTVSFLSSGAISWKKKGINNTKAYRNATEAIDKAKELIYNRKIGKKVKTKNINYYTSKANKLIWTAYGTFNAGLSYMSIFSQTLGGNALASML